MNYIFIPSSQSQFENLIVYKFNLNYIFDYINQHSLQFHQIKLHN